MTPQKVHGNTHPVGEPCKHGHPYKRTLEGKCYYCRKDYERKHRKTAKPPAWLDKDLYWVWQARKSLRKRSAGPRPSLEQLLTLWKKQEGCCAITGLPVEGTPHLDHKLPVSLGGDHDITNLQWTSHMANVAKNAFSTNEVRQWILAAADSIRARGLT